MRGARAAGLLIFLVGTALCSVWAYKWITAAAETFDAGSGGIGAVSLGLAELIVELAALVVPLILTFRLTRAPRVGEWGKALRIAHVGATIGLVAAFFTASWPIRIVVVAAFLPTQVFFANAAVAMWVASREQVDRRSN